MQPAVRVLCFSCLLLGSRRAFAEPDFVRLSLTADPSTSMGLAWNTLKGAFEAEVRYGTVAGQLTERAKGRIFRTGAAALGAISEVTLQGLTPATTYYYRVGGQRGGFSAEGVFRTAPRPHPACGRVRFAFIGDSRSAGTARPRGASVLWPLMAMKIATYRPAFLLHGGDLVYDGRRSREWAHQLKTSTVISGFLPIMPCLGNHDDGPAAGERANYNRVFHLPRAETASGGGGTEDYYAFRYGNALFAVLSSETFTGGKKGKKGPGTAPFAAQAAWLDRVLERTTARWKIVMLHRPIYTRPPPFGHPPSEVGQNAALVPVLQRRGVDLVLASHNHFYERFAPSRCTDGQVLKPCPSSEGTVHITSGGGGAWIIPIAGRTDGTRPAAAAKHHFLLVDIVDERLTIRALDQRGRTLDEHTMVKPSAASDRCVERTGERSPRHAPAEG